MEITELFGFQPVSGKKIPLFTMSVSAGKPVPVESEIEKDIDLNEFLVEHPASTFFARVSGKPLRNAELAEGDILIVDTSLDPKDGNIVVVSFENSMAVKIFRDIDGTHFIESDNGTFLPVSIEPYIELKPVGVVTKVIHSI